MRALHLLVASCCAMAGVMPVSVSASPMPVKAAVLRSTGTMFLGQTIWADLNSSWSQFGDTPVQIDHTSLAGYDWTLQDVQAAGADVLILSAPGYMGYTQAEIDAIREYVLSGHGLIYTYGLFNGADRALAPLVGLSESISLGTGISSVPMSLDPLVPQHPVLGGVSQPYVTGVSASARYLGGPSWPVDGGEVVANLVKSTGYLRGAGIVAKDAGTYRGVYFSYYIEDKADGANLQDMQVFYNALLWTPEPNTLCVLTSGAAMVLARRRRRGQRR